MKPQGLYFLLITVFFSVNAHGQTYKGFNLTENGEYSFKANPSGTEKSKAQIAVDRAVALGANHLIINVRAKMVGPTSSEIVPVTGAGKTISEEAREMRSLVNYARGFNLTIGLRPIFFVVGPNGEFPYIESTANGDKTWWHGNIQPKDPNRWFDQFQAYINRYLTIGRAIQVDTFTIGAELYSMTVGIEDQWQEYPFGFPGRWLQLLRYSKSKLPTTKFSYDINFTDDVDKATGLTLGGGEMERWRYRIVDLANPSDRVEAEIWQSLVNFWLELDFIGIDMYRSLAFESDDLPSQSADLLALLTLRSKAYADQLDQTLFDIELTVGQAKLAALKEVGYRSVENGFIEPFTYATSLGALNIEHQALSYQALFQGFWEPGFAWFDGISFWDISLSPELHGEKDKGFSPVGKFETEQVILKYFKGQ